jgi:microcystin degradation protein MlrC
MLVVADGRPDLAETYARQIGLEFYAMRRQLERSLPNIAAALDEAARLPGLTVIADMGDNPGGGAPGDNTALLGAMLERNLSNAAIGSIWDPMAVMACAEAGHGARLDIRLGGKAGPVSGTPLDIHVHVRAIRDDYHATGFPGTRVNMGTTVLLDVEGVSVVVNTLRNQTFHPDLFTGLGIDLSNLRLVAVKSIQHFRSGFDTVADHVIPVATPGALNFDYGNIGYRNRRAEPFFPKVFDPLAVG